MPARDDEREVTPSWIKAAVRHPKSLNILLGKGPDDRISDDVLKKAASLPGILGKRARFALTIRRMSQGGRQCQCETRKKDAEGHGIRCTRRAVWICRCGTLYCRQHFRKAMKAGMTCRVDPVPTKEQEGEHEVVRVRTGGAGNAVGSVQLRRAAAASRSSSANASGKGHRRPSRSR